MSEIFHMEIWGKNNSFQVEVHTEFEAAENLITGKVYYTPEVECVYMLHGEDRRREITNLLTQSQLYSIAEEIDRQKLLEAEEARCYHKLCELENKTMTYGLKARSF